jgi:hypothetical protein
MKTMFALFFSLVALAVPAQTNAVHNWTLKSGAVFPGDYFTSGAKMVVIKSNGTNCLLKISELSTNDWLYFQNCKAVQRQRQLDAEAAQMLAAGKIELDGTLLKHFPEKIINRQCWLDGEFEELSDLFLYGQDKDYVLRFYIRDKNGESCLSGVFKKDPHTDQVAPELAEVMQLKHGDRVRLFGSPIESEDGNHNLRFYVTQVEMIESAADAAAVKKVRQDLENPNGFDSHTGLPILDPSTGLPK